MGKKKYFCDFCQRAFNDDQQTRSSHSNSANHLREKQEHYNNFKDAATLLKEEETKLPCNKFRNDGFCSFGALCKYSHLLPNDLNNLREQLHAQQDKLVSPQEWWNAHQKSRSTTSSRILSYKTPEGWQDLPPSLVPFDVADYLKMEVPVWGDQEEEKT